MDTKGPSAATVTSQPTYPPHRIPHCYRSSWRISADSKTRSPGS